MRDPCRPILTALMALALASCSVGNLSYDEAMLELDSVTRLDQGAEGGERIVYREDAELLPWWTKFWMFVPLKPILRLFFDASLRPGTLENPSEYARDLMVVVGGEARGDLVRTAAVAQRLVRVMQLDSSALDRIVALHEVAAMLEALGMDVLEGVLDPDLQPVAREGQATWIDALRRNRPAARTGGTALTAERRVAYLEALAELTRQPLSQPGLRLALVHDLELALFREPEPALREATAQALSRSLHWCMQRALLEAMQGVDYEWSEVRRAAIAQVHRLAGPDAVPVILALVGNSPEQVLEGIHALDPDPFVRIRLIHMCGQLDEERGRIAVRLPGRESLTPVSPIDVLVSEILDPDPLYPGLQTLAIEALSRCLQRPVVYEEDWVREWYVSSGR